MNTALTPAPEHADVVTHVAITETSWCPAATLPWDEWVDQGRRLGVMGRACQWWIGDWINYGEHQYGERYAQAVDVTGLDLGTLMHYASVAGRIPQPDRVNTLSWSHHREVAYLDPPDRDHYLNLAQENELPVSRLAQLVKANKQHAAAADPGQLSDFVTQLRIEHTAPDQAAADEWAQKHVARLAVQGARVTYRSTTLR